MDKILSKAFKVSDIEHIENEINDMNLEIKKKENDNILEANIEKPKYTKEELTDDGLPTVEVQLRELKEKDDEFNKRMEEKALVLYKREMCQRVKCLCLLKMNKSIFTNTFNMKEKERKKLQELMWEYNNIDHKDIISEFNDKVGELLDDMEEKDYSKLPVYDF